MNFLLESSGGAFLLFAVVAFVVVGIVLLIRWLISENEKKHTAFLTDHSAAIKGLEELNREFVFSTIKCFDMSHEYDNEAYFETVSPRDYLTYQLVYIHKDVRDAIKIARENKTRFIKYSSRLKELSFGKYDGDTSGLSIPLLVSTEKAMFEIMRAKPTIDFSIYVVLHETNMRGRRYRRKAYTFNENEIEEILAGLSHKQGDFYLDQNIWDAIVRVERAKVSNKLRFAIMQRDGNRCRKCGRRSGRLEIDHIYPISKGGKTTYENLQTLCHDCNAKKSNTIETTTRTPSGKIIGKKVRCPKCGAEMILRHGRNGDFYGCSKYPQCKGTSQI